MSLGRVSEWHKLPLSLAELCIDTTLRCGQSFRWKKLGDEWVCALHGRIITLKQDPSHLQYRVTWPAKLIKAPKLPSSVKGETVKNGTVDDDTEVLLRNYLSLKLDLTALYRQWSTADPNFRKRAPQFEGVRILSQDPWETLIGFICSSNNNISRISQMVHKLCKHYGPLIGTVQDEPFHDFPPPEALTGSQVESHLRELGFGYRAKYIADTARIVANEKPKGWLESLTNPENPAYENLFKADDLPEITYKEAHDQLLQLTGVGPKVADCVCLMGLGWGEAVPVDTHVWQIAQRDYKFGKTKTKTFNKAMYDAVGDHFRELWGSYAGWAHSVLFTADLRAFSDRSPKKEDAKVVKIEEAVVTTEQTTPSGRKRKTVKTTVKVEFEADIPGDIATVERSVKRRKTRSQA